MAADALILTEFIKVVSGVVSTLIGRFMERHPRDQTRAAAYNLFDEFTKMESYIEELESALDAYFKAFQQGFGSEDERHRCVEKIANIIDNVIRTGDRMKKATTGIRLQYSVYKDIRDIRSIREYYDSEAGFGIQLLGTVDDCNWSELSNKQRATALRDLHKVAVQLREKIGEFIRENYNFSDRPDGT